MQAQVLPQQIQKTILAPIMQQSIEVLLLAVTELNLSIEQELQSNPLLEINEEAPAAQDPGPKKAALYDDDPLRFLRGPLQGQYSSDDETLEDIPVKIESSLEESLLQQLRVEPLDPLELKIGEYFIGNLDEDGYLKITCEEVAGALGVEDHALIDRVLKVIQGFEPSGIASRNLEECLSIQLAAMRPARHDIYLAIITGHLQDLGRKRFQQISEDIGISLPEIKEAANFIAGLEPKPARNFRPIRSSTYIQPDVFILKDKERGYYVEVSREGIPSLRVNAYYRNLLGRAGLSEKDREFIQERFRNATNFIKSIEQRGHTLRRITEYVLIKQMAFFDRGEDLSPMVLKDVAQAISRNESTISRAISNKYIDTPRGMFPMKFFFSRGIHPIRTLSAASDDAQGSVASRSVKDEIQNIIVGEDKTAPLSDQDIQHYFKRRNMQIARRTISKYRQALRILPSNLRKV
ncbi:MAG: RNA polymerase factor sigma-54 [Candidatus Omnitrophica bacterium]|nr:RNA polymerase factor sigma-54 [Candidatus Omnitrophota bacterium]